MERHWTHKIGCLNCSTWWNHWCTVNPTHKPMWTYTNPCYPSTNPFWTQQSTQRERDVTDASKMFFSCIQASLNFMGVPMDEKIRPSPSTLPGSTAPGCETQIEHVLSGATMISLWIVFHSYVGRVIKNGHWSKWSKKKFQWIELEGKFIRNS